MNVPSSWYSPVVVLESGAPVGCTQQCLHGTGQVHKHIAHEKEPATVRTGGHGSGALTPEEQGHPHRKDRITHMESMGATLSREAMRMPISQMKAVSSSAHVGSPLDFP